MASRIIGIRNSALTFGSGVITGAAWQHVRENPNEWEKTKLGLTRSAAFWMQALPIWLRYRFMQWKVNGLPDDEQVAAFEPLHDMWAKPAVDIILQLRGFYVKIGQLASTRADFLPKQYYDRVKTLQSEVPSESVDYIRGLVEASLDKKLTSVFRDFDERPLGTASIGQVHRATLRDGRDVVVKVMFPNVETMFRSDIKTMKDFCALAQPEHLVLLSEVEKQFLTEFDFREEAKNLNLIRENMRNAWRKKVVVPEAFMATPTVLIMERVPGKMLVDALHEHMEDIARARGMTVDELSRESQEREARGETIVSPSAHVMALWRGSLRVKTKALNAGRLVHNVFIAPLTGSPPKQYEEARLPLNTEKLINLLFRVHGHQIFMDGAFNGDPHPGNILLTPDGKLGLIDYGQVKHMGVKERVKLARLIVALAEDDKSAVVKAYTEMGVRTKRMDPEVLYLHAKASFDDDHKDSLGGMNVQLYLEWLQSRDPVMSLSDDFVMAGRVATILRGLAYAVKHKPSVAKLWAPQARQLLADYDRLNASES